MLESYYVPSVKVNAAISDSVIDGCHIEFEGRQYEQLSKKPRGRRIKRTFIKQDESERLVIYN